VRFAPGVSRFRLLVLAPFLGRYVSRDDSLVEREGSIAAAEKERGAREDVFVQEEFVLWKPRTASAKRSALLEDRGEVAVSLEPGQGDGANRR
jgi:hypothetical protein